MEPFSNEQYPVELKQSIYYNPDLILKNIYAGFVRHLGSYLKENNIRKTFDHNFSDDRKLSCFLSWMIESYNEFKDYKHLCKKDLSRKTNITLSTRYKLKLDDHLKLFPPYTYLFRMDIKDDYFMLAKHNCDLLFNRYDDSFSDPRNYSLISKTSFFADFTLQSQIKQLNSLLLDNNFRLENFFSGESNNCCIQDTINVFNSDNKISLNEMWPENLDFIVFCFKCLGFFDEQTLYTNWMIHIRLRESNENPTQFEAELRNKFLDNLQYLDCKLTKRIIGYILFFSKFNIFYIENKELDIKWNDIFGENSTPISSVNNLDDTSIEKQMFQMECF
jgi:hypothetical protein